MMLLGKGGCVCRYLKYNYCIYIYMLCISRSEQLSNPARLIHLNIVLLLVILMLFMGVLLIGGEVHQSALFYVICVKCAVHSDSSIKYTH